ncbi:MAG TPA: response regulator transcription factor [Methylomirabilota bacterium]|nr:response regulator transcription factor [Methylomirabilota bacterium]
MRIKVLVADDNELVRSALVRMLEADADLAVIGEAATFAETLELVDGLKPDIVLPDLHMPDEKNYLPGSVKLKVLENAGCILAISVWNDHEAKVLADRFGAKALIDKAHLFSELIPAIKAFCLES